MAELRVYGLSSSGVKGSRKPTSAGVDDVTQPGEIYGVEVLRTDVSDHWVISNYFSSLAAAKECAARYNDTNHIHAHGGENLIARVVCNVANKVEAAYERPEWHRDSDLADTHRNSGADSPTEIERLMMAIRKFVDARDWAQFHTPRNLVLALAGEVGELAAEMQWIADVDAEEALAEPTKSAAVESEIADVAIYVLRLADVLGINLAEAIAEKLRLNEQRYPADQARGNARKYTQLGG